MTAPFHIRKATAADMDGPQQSIREVYRLARNDARARGESPLGPPRYRAWAAAIDTPNHQLLVAEAAGGDVLGFAHATHTLHGEHTTINTLAVHPQHQHQGVGTALVDAIREHASAQNKSSLQTSAQTGVAARFYQRLGFKTVQTTAHGGHVSVDKLAQRIV